MWLGGGPKKPTMKTTRLFALLFAALFGVAAAADKPAKAKKKRDPLRPTPMPEVNDAKNTDSGKPKPEEDPALAQFGIYAESAPVAERAAPVATTRPPAAAAVSMAASWLR